jgi:maleylacetate reductase
MKKFTFDYMNPRVVFGAGAVSALPDELARLGSRRLLVLSSPYQREFAQNIVRPIAGRVAGYFDGATMHVPVEVIQQAERAFIDLEADSIIAIGGDRPPDWQKSFR